MTSVCGSFVCTWREFDRCRPSAGSSPRTSAATAQRAGLSQEALAELCDLHRTEISLLERCKRSPRLETIVILSRGLQLTSPAELLDGIA